MNLLSEGNKRIKRLCNRLGIPLKTRLVAQIIYSRVFSTSQHDHEFLSLCCINLACKIIDTYFDENLIFNTNKINYKEIKEIEKYICNKINHNFNIFPIHFIYIKFAKILNKGLHYNTLTVLDEIHEDDRILKIKYFENENKMFCGGDVALSLFKDSEVSFLVDKMGMFH
ncbi:cyclin K [Tubulinosema ratisbonensis]|uniref:Cyclin K n=1 Tax=Tubulinosema ratisbonensis TaxID=291195 RepID=A0A437ALW3_9MICR|nr:cyclin K [Tubulinosema ratisbonensis]